MIWWCSHLVVLCYFLVMLMFIWRYCEVSYYLYLVIVTSFDFFFETVKYFVRAPARVLSIGGHGVSSFFLALSSPFAVISLSFFPNISVFLNSLYLSFVISPLIITKIEISCHYAHINFLIQWSDELKLTYSLNRVV